MVAGAARAGPGATPGDAGRYGAKRQGADYLGPVVLLLAKRGGNSIKTPYKIFHELSDVFGMRSHRWIFLG